MNNTKIFIKKFDFTNPDWSDLPETFPNLPKTGLTRQEEHLLDAIKLAHFANEGGWKASTGKAGRIGLISLIGLIVFIGLISLISSPEGELTRTVQAAGVQADEIIQSTMSAIMRR